MRGAAMSLTAAASGLVVFLLSVSAGQSQDGWDVTYSSTKICAVKGSTVEMRCSFTYPSTWKGSVNRVEKTFWFTKWSKPEPVDVTTDSEYAGRVEDLCENNTCTLRIKNLRESDSAEYMFKFRVTTNRATHWGYPGTTLSVRDLQVHVSKSGSSTRLQCLSSCPPGHTSYIWFKNGQKIKEDTFPYAYFIYESADSYYCALTGYEDFPSPAVYAPKLPSVSVSPSAEIEEGSSVTLTCSSEANPAANYIWYKRNVNKDLSSVNEGPLLVLSSIQSSDSGEYYCRAENLLEITSSESIFIDVKYAPKLPSVSVSPSTGIKEGSSVTLTCSSDANPAANYTWYKRDEDSPKASGQIFTITDFRAEHSGSYSCGAQNKLGCSNSTLTQIVVAWSSTMIVNIIGTTLGVLMLILALLLSLWMRKKKALRSTTEAPEPVEIEMLT
ncbi:B-cell receptor CD22-like [Pseudochaenichthys georgianus]|uniref:B-cell receptor CD22-like n=1 Tax=Pseudochaenichthys georgianus TaxID=52239 RepID=UPI00146D27CB|nr:B-cell receptor CD22-like [Pseudochaenichthys georgianus]